MRMRRRDSVGDTYKVILRIFVISYRLRRAPTLKSSPRTSSISIRYRISISCQRKKIQPTRWHSLGIIEVLFYSWANFSRLSNTQLISSNILNFDYDCFTFNEMALGIIYAEKCFKMLQVQCLLTSDFFYQNTMEIDGRVAKYQVMLWISKMYIL